MAGESPDWGSVATIQGPPLVGPVVLGPQTLANSSVLATTDVSGFAGVLVLLAPSTQGNVQLLLQWGQQTLTGLTETATDRIQVPSIANASGTLGSFFARWFPALGQSLKVTATASVAATYDGLITIVPTVVAYPGKSLGGWGGGSTRPSFGSGVLADQAVAVGAGATNTVFARRSWWGPAFLTWGTAPGAGSTAEVQSFSYTDQLVCNQKVGTAGVMTAPIELLLPAACYHKLLFFNNGAGAITPNMSLIVDLI